MASVSSGSAGTGPATPEYIRGRVLTWRAASGTTRSPSPTSGAKAPAVPTRTTVRAPSMASSSTAIAAEGPPMQWHARVTREPP